jgi:hypothetical protein
MPATTTPSLDYNLEQISHVNVRVINEWDKSLLKWFYFKGFFDRERGASGGGGEIPQNDTKKQIASEWQKCCSPFRNKRIWPM